MRLQCSAVSALQRTDHQIAGLQFWYSQADAAEGNCRVHLLGLVLVEEVSLLPVTIPADNAGIIGLSTGEPDIVVCLGLLPVV